MTTDKTSPQAVTDEQAAQFWEAYNEATAIKSMPESTKAALNKIGAFREPSWQIVGVLHRLIAAVTETLGGGCAPVHQIMDEARALLSAQPAEADGMPAWMKSTHDLFRPSSQPQDAKAVAGDGYEQRYAIKEAARIAASEEYFTSRNWPAARSNVKLFEDGFDRGYDSTPREQALAQPVNTSPEHVQGMAVCEHLPVQEKAPERGSFLIALHNGEEWAVELAAQGLLKRAQEQAPADKDAIDAARYRLLRDGGNHDYRLFKHVVSGMRIYQQLDGEQLDRLMDKAMNDHKESWMTKAALQSQPQQVKP